MRFPAVELVSDAPESPPRESTGLTLDGLRVLLVDDDTHALEALGELLELAGAQVRTAGSADEGWAAAVDTAHEPPQALVSDVAMPGADGYSLVRRLRERERADGGGSRLYVVALTGLATLQDRDAAIAAGFDDHLAKPVDVDLLIEKLLAARPR